jgi:hypothetical protein
MTDRPFTPNAAFWITIVMAMIAWGYYAATHDNPANTSGEGLLVSPG